LQPLTAVAAFPKNHPSHGLPLWETLSWAGGPRKGEIFANGKIIPILVVELFRDQIQTENLNWLVVEFQPL